MRYFELYSEPLTYILGTKYVKESELRWNLIDSHYFKEILEEEYITGKMLEELNR